MKENIFLEQPRRGKTHEVQLTPHKAAGRSMGLESNTKAAGRSMRMLTIILLLVTITACDPGYYESMVIRNESSHTVTVIPGTRECGTGEPSYTVENKTYTLAPSEEVVIQGTGGIGEASLEEGIEVFLQYYGDSVTFRFNGETEPQIVYYRTDTTGISPYNFNSTHYKYEEKHHYGRWFNGHSTYGKLTYVVTEEQMIDNS